MLSKEKKSCFALDLFKTHTSSTMIKSSKFPSQCNHIRAKSMLVCCPKRSTLVDDKCNQTEEIGLVKRLSLANKTVSKAAVQNAAGLGFLIIRILNRITPHVSVQFWMYHLNNLLSQYAALNFKPKTIPMDFYLGTCDLPPPWNSATSETQRNHWPDRYSGHFRKSLKKFKVNPTFKYMNK
ncbi:hypothetical protein ACTXT7_002103 [Hymenolepis weldensis]